MSEITVVGCGAMGSRLINAFMNEGHDVVVVDLNKDKAEEFIRRGARYSATLQDAPETDAIIINVPHHEIARKILSSCTKERLEGKYYISTTGVSCLNDIEEMKKITDEYGLNYLEAKIESYPEAVGRETGYMVYSGNREAYEKNAELLRALGKPVYVGEDLTWAWISDMAVIGIHGGAMFALYEIAALCLQHGYPMDKLCQIAEDGLALCLEENYRQLVEELKDYNGEFEDSKGTDIIIEERGTHMVLDALKSSGVEPIVTGDMMKVYNELIDAGYGRKNMVAVINKMLGKM